MKIKLDEIKKETITPIDEDYVIGTVERVKFKCPCGQSEVIYEDDKTPGYRSTDVYTFCKNCQGKYTFSYGIAELIE